MENTVVKAFVVSGEKILILKQKPNEHDMSFWELPGGKVEGSEAKEEAILREIREETGLALGSCIHIGTQTVITNGALWKEEIFFCVVDTDVVKINFDEHIDYRWIDFNELTRLEDSAIQKYEIDFYKSYINKSL